MNDDWFNLAFNFSVGRWGLLWVLIIVAYFLFFGIAALSERKY